MKNLLPTTLLLLTSCTLPTSAPTPGHTTATEIKPPTQAKTCCELAHGLKDGPVHVAKGTGYYPDSSALEGGFHDRYGKPIQTLQSFLKGNSEYVGVALDKNLGRVKRPICIAELNKRYGTNIPFLVNDTGGAFTDKGWTRVDIATENKKASVDSTVNGTLTITECK